MSFIFDPSLVLYLPLYALDGDSLMSRDTYGHRCTVTGARWTPPGRSFDGSDDVINCGNAPSLDITEAITIEAWVRSSDYTSIRDICGKGDTQAYNLRQSYNGNGTLTLTLVIAGTGRHLNYSAAGYWDGNWHHIVATYDGVRRALHIDKELKKEDSSYSGNLATTATNLFIGSASGAGNFHGLIGELRIYRRALTLPEIQHNYLAAKWRYR